MRRLLPLGLLPLGLLPLGLLPLGLLLPACASMPTAPPPSDARPAVQAHPWYGTAHHGDGRFANPWRAEGDEVPPLKAARWMVTYPFRNKPDQRPAGQVPLDAAALAEPPSGARITWLGHSTVLLQIGRTTILTDPVFADRASPVAFAGPAREVPLPLDPDALPPIHLVLLSHDHYDHLDLAAVERLVERDRPLLLVPLRLGDRLGTAPAVELDWWQYVDVEGADDARLRVHCAPAKHFSGRTLTDRDRTLWASWYVEPLDGELPEVYYAGDTAYAPHFAQVRERLGAPDVVLMPVGAYRPRWFMRRVHVDPDEALQGFEDLGAGRLVAVHWGTFDLADEPLEEPARLLPERAAARGLDADRLHVLPVGGQVEVER